MIRKPAALKLAQSIYDPFIKAGYDVQQYVDDVAALIQTAVETDELRQQIEQNEQGDK